MKKVCVPIYSKRFEYPIDLNRIYKGNSCGLCNQLTQIINLIAIGTTDFYIDVFSMDLYKGRITPISNILDLNLMNSKHGMDIRDAVFMEESEAANIIEINWNSPFLVYWRDPERFKEATRKIEINESFKNMGRSISEKRGVLNKEVNLIHLRIDDDFRDHCRAEIDPYYNSIVDKYEKEIYEKCSKEIPLCILIDTYSHDLVKKLERDYEVIYLTKEECDTYLPEEFRGMRDIYAFCDFSFSVNLNIKNLIILENMRETSSFSILLKSYLDYEKCTEV